MLRLNENSSGQFVYLTLKEAVKEFTTSYADYLIEFSNATTSAKSYMIGNVSTDNDRYTKLEIGTDVNDALNGSLILKEGEYNYKVYGQNSTTNLDPTDGVVVGVLEIGLLRVITDASHFTEYEPTINDDKQYNG